MVAWGWADKLNIVPFLVKSTVSMALSVKFLYEA